MVASARLRALDLVTEGGRLRFRALDLGNEGGRYTVQDPALGERRW